DWSNRVFSAHFNLEQTANALLQGTSFDLDSLLIRLMRLKNKSRSPSVLSFVAHFLGSISIATITTGMVIGLGIGHGDPKTFFEMDLRYILAIVSVYSLIMISQASARHIRNGNYEAFGLPNIIDPTSNQKEYQQILQTCIDKVESCKNAIAALATKEN